MVAVNVWVEVSVAVGVAVGEGSDYLGIVDWLLSKLAEGAGELSTEK